MIWKSIGLIFSKKNFQQWNKTHAWVPTPIIIKDDRVRVFFAGRDISNHSNVSYFDISLKKPTNILKIAKKPVLQKGLLGCFDDCAVIPSQIIKYKNKFYMYYIGWTGGVSVPYIASIGLAISSSLDDNFVRYSHAPIIGRSSSDPIFTASCFVTRKNKKFTMIYTSNKSWKKKSFFVPDYGLKYCHSADAIHWKPTSKTVLRKNSTKEIAITRPWLVQLDKKNFLFYSYKNYANKGRNYKIGFAEEKNNSFVRKDKHIKILNAKDSFDKNMQEYSSIVEYENHFYMFYNGNNYGEEGVGLAVISKDNFLKKK